MIQINSTISNSEYYEAKDGTVRLWKYLNACCQNKTNFKNGNTPPIKQNLQKP